MNFFTLFPDFTNIQFTKEVGLVPYYLAKDFGYESTIVSFDNDDLDTEKLKELKFDIITRKFSNSSLNYLLVIIYIIKNAKKIDVFNYYHFYKINVLFCLIYKLFNRNGIAFNTMDTNYDSALAITGNKKGFKLSLHTKIHRFLFKHVIDFATIETKEVYDVFVESHNIYREKLMYMPIFIDINPNINELSKKNEIISVGRIGIHQKASEIVLQSFKNAISEVDDEEWILKMVGPVYDGFEEYIETFFKENPDLKKSIVFTGNIENRDELFKIYSQSKIFCLPSRSESFGLVFAEALYYDNYLIITDVGVGKYIVDNSNFGKIVEVDDVDDISEKLVDAMINYDSYHDNNDFDFRKFVCDEFSHEKFIEKLDISLKKLKN